MSSSGTQLTAFVSGGNRGIGLQVCKDIVAHAASGGLSAWLGLGCRNLEQGKALAAELSSGSGGKVAVEAIELDVLSAESIRAAAASVEARVAAEGLTVLVNNAGIMLEAQHPIYTAAAAEKTWAVNFEGVVAVTDAFLPLLLRSTSAAAPGDVPPADPHMSSLSSTSTSTTSPTAPIILSTSSGVGARTLGLVSEEHRAALLAEDLDEEALRRLVQELLREVNEDEAHPYRSSIPSLGYGVSKMAVNCYTMMLARRWPAERLRVNACSPGFTNTDMCRHYTGSRVPKDVPLGASVAAKVIFGALGEGRTGTFFKEASKAGTSLEDATSVVDAWVQ